MASIEQGGLLKVEGIQHPVIVVSNDYFNESGRAIVCPILKKAAPGPLHIQLRETEVDGYVLWRAGALSGPHRPTLFQAVRHALL